jgi:cell pole-organizing protein PopZ
MSDTKSQPEPSMEEILASIRRIIAEDSDAAAPAAAEPAAAAVEPIAAPPAPAAPPAEDVLELTQIIADDPPQEKPMSKAPQTTPELEPALSSKAEADRLVSDTTAVASSSSFASVANVLRSRRSSDIGIGNGAQTLEELVRDMLRPMLQDWLDAHLAKLVERLVNEEIQRLARDAL